MSPIITADEIRVKLEDFAKNSPSKLTVIFGAGASRGYSQNENYPFKPPMVSELLESSIPFIHQMLGRSEHADIAGQRAHIQKRIKGLGGDLEAYLSDIYKNGTADNRFPSMLRYLEDVFTNVSLQADLNNNHYQLLVTTLHDLRGRKKWSILTFNYDTILERSIKSLPLSISKSFDTDADYRDSNLQILKMHGGVNFRYIYPIDPEASSRPSAYDVFSKMMGDSRSVDEFLALKDIDTDVPNVIGYRTYPNIGGRTVVDFPLMMIPVHASVKTANSFFSKQIERAKKEISESEMVIAIGYQFGDGAFLESLKDIDLKDSNLVLVGSKNLLAENVNSKAYKQASKVWPEENIKIFGEDDFSSFVNALY